jgi:4-amino-4-deoxy-L-arabinose transferase-like glycosyltransferase
MKTRQILIDAAGVGLLALIILIGCHSVAGRRHLRAIVDNDAVGYTSAARSLAEKGHIESHIIYPSTLSQKATKSWLYMPGFYYTLAAVYKLVGFSTMKSIVVSGAGYTIAAICTFLIGFKVFDRRTGLCAAGLFLIYPANLYYSSTAMSETSLVAAAALAFCIFVHLPRRWMIWAGPTLVVLPFLFRETGAFLALPMALFLLLPTRSPNEAGTFDFVSPSIFIALAVLILGIVYISPISSGRPSLIKLDIFVTEKGAERIYRDAMESDRIKATPGDWWRTLTHRFGENSGILLKRIVEQQRRFTILVLLPLVFAIPAGLIWGAWKRDGISLGAGALLLLTLGFVCMFYSVRHDRPVRVAMFGYPLVAILQARLVIALWGVAHRWLAPGYRHWVFAICCAGVGSWVIATVYKGFVDMAAWDLADERGNAFIESLTHDDHRMLVGPHLLCIPYLERHYPVQFAFVPANKETLALLCKKYDVQTLVLNPADAIDLKPADVIAEGFRLFSRCHLVDPEHLEGHYLVFRRPDFFGEAEDWNVETESTFNWSPRRFAQY